MIPFVQCLDVNILKVSVGSISDSVMFSPAHKNVIVAQVPFTVPVAHGANLCIIVVLFERVLVFEVVRLAILVDRSSR